MAYHNAMDREGTALAGCALGRLDSQAGSDGTLLRAGPVASELSCRGGHLPEWKGCERRRWGARGPLMTNLSRTNDPVLVNQVQDNSAAVIASTREEGRNIGGKDRSSRLNGYNRDQVIRRTFLVLGLAASRKHREVVNRPKVGVCRHEIVATIRIRVRPQPPDACLNRRNWSGADA